MAIDVCKPLKIENPANGGTQLDMFPTEVTPSQDYVGGKGFSFEATQTETIRGDSGTITITTGGTDRTTLNNSGLLTHTGSIRYVDGNQALGSVLTSSATGVATWQPPISANATEISSTTTATASSTTDTLMTGMTFTFVTAGTYLVLFSCDINSGTAGAAVSVSYYFAGTQAANSLRKVIPFSGGTLSSGSGRSCVAINDLMAVTAGQVLEVRWSVSSGSVTAASRTLDIIRVM